MTARPKTSGACVRGSACSRCTGTSCSRQALPEVLRGWQPAEQGMLLELAQGSHVRAVHDEQQLPGPAKLAGIGEDICS